VGRDVGLDGVDRGAPAWRAVRRRKVGVRVEVDRACRKGAPGQGRGGRRPARGQGAQGGREHGAAL
jgi:hypothetical protein